MEVWELLSPGVSGLGCMRVCGRCTPWTLRPKDCFKLRYTFSQLAGDRPVLLPLVGLPESSLLWSLHVWLFVNIDTAFASTRDANLMTSQCAWGRTDRFLSRGSHCFGLSSRCENRLRENVFLKELSRICRSYGCFDSVYLRSDLASVGQTK